MTLTLLKHWDNKVFLLQNNIFLLFRMFICNWQIKDCLQIKIIMQITSNNKELIKILFLLNLLLSVTANGLFFFSLLMMKQHLSLYLCKMLLWFLNMILNCLWNLFNKDKKGQQQAKKENIHYFSQLWVKCTNSKFYEKFKSQISRSLDSLQPLLAKWSTIYAKKAIKNLFLNKKYSKLMLRERQQETKKAIRLINSLKNFIWIRYKMCWVGTLKIRKTRLHAKKIKKNNNTNCNLSYKKN